MSRDVGDLKEKISKQVEEKEIKTNDKTLQALKNLSDVKQSTKQISNISINEKDVMSIVSEFEIEVDIAKAALKESGGDLQKTYTHLIRSKNFH